MIQDKGKASQGTETGKSKLESQEPHEKWGRTPQFWGMHPTKQGGVRSDMGLSDAGGVAATVTYTNIVNLDNNEAVTNVQAGASSVDIILKHQVPPANPSLLSTRSIYEVYLRGPPSKEIRSARSRDYVRSVIAWSCSTKNTKYFLYKYPTEQPVDR